MAKFDLGGNVMDEFARIAIEKGWIITEAQGGLSPRQQSYLKALMYKNRNTGMTEQEALQQAQQNPKLWAELAKPEPPKPPAFTPKVPEWVNDPEGYQKKKEMEGVLPKGEEILSEIPKRMYQKLLDRYLERGMSMDEAKQKAQWMIQQMNADDMEALAMSKEKNLLKVSAIADELRSLANDLDSMGEKEAADAVDKQLALFKEAADKFYDVTGETGEKFIGEAHPGGGPTMVPAKEEGGKVETVVEQQKKDIDVANKEPTGKYAETIMRLVATANRLEDEGNIEAAQMVDKAIEELRQAALPFAGRNLGLEATSSKDKKASTRQAGVTEFTAKELGGGGAAAAAGGAVKAVGKGALVAGKAAVSGVGAAATSIGTAFGAAGATATAIGGGVIAAVIAIPLFAHYGSSWFSQVETIATDIQDLLDYADKLTGEDPKIPAAVDRLKQILTPFRSSLSDETLQLNALAKNPEQIGKIAQTYAQFGAALAEAAGLVNTIGKLSEAWTWNPSKWNFFNTHKRLVSKLDDLKKSYGDQYAIFQQLVKGAQQKAKEEGKEGGGGSGGSGGRMEKVRQEEFSKYIGTLDKLSNFFTKNNRVVERAFGSGATDKWLKGIDEEKELAKKYDWKTLQKSNDAVYNRLVPFLKSKKIWAFDAHLVIKKLGAGLADLLQNVPEPQKAKGKAVPGKGKGRARVEKDPQVEALQNALNSAGLSVKVDGLWGPNTAAAYNSFIDKNIGLEKHLQPIANPRAQKHANRPTAILPKAVRIIQYMAGREREVGSSTIELGGGIEVPIDAMNTPQSFVDHMQGVLNSQTFPPSSALQYLSELERYVSANAMEMEGKQAGTARMWQQAVRDLTRKFQQFERQARGNKAFQYPWQVGQAGAAGGYGSQSAPSGQPGQAGAGGAYSYVGRGGGAAGTQTINWNSLQSGRATMPDIAAAMDSLPDEDTLMDPDSFVGEAKLKGYKAPEKYLDVVDNQLRIIQFALKGLRGRVPPNQKQIYDKVRGDAYTYSGLLRNTRTMLGSR